MNEPDRSGTVAAALAVLGLAAAGCGAMDEEAGRAGALFQPQRRAVGAPCARRGDCGEVDGVQLICIAGEHVDAYLSMFDSYGGKIAFPGGYCSLRCDDRSERKLCPLGAACTTQSFPGSEGFCAAGCASHVDCRPGYACLRGACRTCSAVYTDDARWGWRDECATAAAQHTTAARSAPP